MEPPPAKAQAPIIAYTPPDWSAKPTQHQFKIEVLKDGAILETIDLPRDKEYVTVGRLPVCDVSLEHASVSRYHAVLQFKGDGTVYVYDLGSTHGTRLNKQVVPAKQHVRVPLGGFLKFGESARSFILQGPPDLEDATEQEARQIVSGKLAQRRQHQLQKLQKALAGSEEDVIIAEGVDPDTLASANKDEDQGVTWGMQEDATEDEEGAVVDGDDDWYLRDPKKILRGWFDQHGENMDITYEEDGPGHARIYNAKLRLPIEGSFGTEIFATGTGGKKKDAEKEVIIDACQKLQQRGLLRTNDPVATAAAVEARKRRLKELYGDDDQDQDEFYDRASSQLAGKKAKHPAVQTFESLSSEHAELSKERAEVSKKLAQLGQTEKKAAVAMAMADDDEDDLDAFMNSVSTSISNEGKARLEKELQAVDKEISRVEKLMAIAKPTSMPAFAENSATISNITSTTSSVAKPSLPETAAPVEDDDGFLLPQSFNALKGSSSLPKPKPARLREESAATATEEEASKTETGHVIRPGTDEDVIHADSSESAPTSQKRKGTKKTFGAMTRESYDEQVAKDLSEWTPPVNQSGDGRTSLNEKYGY